MTWSQKAIWAATAALCAGLALGYSGVPVRIAAVLLAWAGVAALGGRRAALLSLMLLAGAAGLADASLHRPSHGPLSRLATTVPRCAAAGRVVERIGALGTKLHLTRLECPGGAVLLDAGEAVADGDAGEPGGSFSGESYVVPLGEGAFAGARRREGIEAELTVDGLRFDEAHGSAHAVAAAARDGLAVAVRGVAPDRAALLAGLTVGDTSRMGRDTIELFRRAGLSHLVAVSGSNLAMVLGVVFFAVRPLGLRSRVVLGAAGLSLFVLIVGPEPSVLRASAMAVAGLIALAGGRPALPLNTLGLGLIAVLILRPPLVFSVGLLLSTAATLGLILWGRSWADAFAPAPRSVAMLTAASLAAQTAVLPVSIAFFGTVSLVAPPANLLAIPAVAPATVIGLGASLVAVFWPGLGALMMRAAEPFAGWILWVARVFGSPQWATLEVPEAMAWVVGAAVATGAWATLRVRPEAAAPS